MSSLYLTFDINCKKFCHHVNKNANIQHKYFPIHNKEQSESNKKYSFLPFLSAPPLYDVSRRGSLCLCVTGCQSQPQYVRFYLSNYLRPIGLTQVQFRSPMQEGFLQFSHHSDILCIIPKMMEMRKQKRKAFLFPDTIRW